VRISREQQPLTTGGITLTARCPDHDCLVGATIAIGDAERRAAAREPAARGYTTLTVRVPRAVRRDLRAGHTMRARITAIAADNAANTTTRGRLVTLRG
jgi:hypothetical protein